MIAPSVQINYVLYMCIVRKFWLALTVIMAAWSLGAQSHAWAGVLTFQMGTPLLGDPAMSGGSGVAFGYATNTSIGASTLLDGSDCSAVGLSCAASVVLLVVDTNFTNVQSPSLGGIVFNVTGIAVTALSVVNNVSFTVPAGGAAAPAQLNYNLSGYTNGIIMSADAVTLMSGQAGGAGQINTTQCAVLGNAICPAAQINGYDIGIVWATNTGTTFDKQKRAVFTITSSSGAISVSNFNATNGATSLTGPDAYKITAAYFNGGNRFTDVTTPEPASLAVLATGLAGLAALRRRRRAV